MIQEILHQVRQQLRPKPESSGLEVEANLGFQDKNVYSQLSIINNKRYMFSSQLWRISLKNFSDQICHFFGTFGIYYNNDYNYNVLQLLYITI